MIPSFQRAFGRLVKPSIFGFLGGRTAKGVQLSQSAFWQSNPVHIEQPTYVFRSRLLPFFPASVFLPVAVAIVAHQRAHLLYHKGICKTSGIFTKKNSLFLAALLTYTKNLTLLSAFSSRQHTGYGI